jgi:DNA polymerase I
MSASALSAPKLLLIDGHSLAFRSYYAHTSKSDGGLRTSTGIPTSASFGFLKALFETMLVEKPQALALAFDLGGPSFRVEIDPTYKANRTEKPEDFEPDLRNLIEVIKALGLPIYMKQGYEADDVLGTLAKRGSAAGYQVKVLSGDRDLFQLVEEDGSIAILYMGSTFGKGNQTREFGRSDVVEKMGVPPEQIVDFKALCGDSSDNIPGVKGIGEKTAIDLLQQFKTLDDIYAALAENPDYPGIKAGVRKKLEADKEAAYRSRQLAQININVDVETNFEDCAVKPFDLDAVQPWIEKLELKTFLRQIEKIQALFGAVPDALAGLPLGSPTSIAPTPIASAPEPSPPAAGPTIELQPQIIDSPTALGALIDHLKQFTDPEQPIAWDTETTGLDARDVELVGIGCCWGLEPNQCAYIPLGHNTLGSINLELKPTIQALKSILEDATYPKVFQNAKFDRLIFKHQGIDLQGVVFDTMLADYLLDPEPSHKLEDIGQRQLGISSLSYGAIVKKGQTMADIDIPTVANYCALDSYVTYALVAPLKAAIGVDSDRYKLLQEVELPLEPILAAMENQGIRIDIGYLHEFSKNLEKTLAEIEAKAYEVAGETFNLGSPKQLSELLFDRLKLSTKKSRKTKTGYSTDASVLEKLQGDHPVIDCILENRTLAKLKSTYVDALPTLVRRDTGRVHTDFNQAVTSTGRLSSSNPNLQNIPIRTAFSRQIRKAFLPQEGWLLVAADYSQIELRILTHLSQEPILLEAYRNGDDVHALTAKLLLEKGDITADERRLGKTINFGVIYGMGAQRFARETGVSNKDATDFLRKYHDRYPGIFNYLQQTEHRAVTQGYVETLLGRRRYVNFTTDSLRKLKGRDPNDETFVRDYQLIRSPGQVDAGILRAAANAPIQGSSADIIKVAMVKLDRLLQPYQARLLLQVHDELILEVPPEEWQELQPQIKSVMEDAVTLSVPLEVDIHAGENWMAAKG